MGKPVVEGSLESPPFEKPSIEQVNNQLFILFYFISFVNTDTSLKLWHFRQFTNASVYYFRRRAESVGDFCSFFSFSIGIIATLFNFSHHSSYALLKLTGFFVGLENET